MALKVVARKPLNWLVDVRQETGLAVATEVANKQHVEACLAKNIDALGLEPEPR